MSLRDAQRMVREFHLKFGATVGATPDVRDVGLRRCLIAEEAGEEDEALCDRDLPGIAKELCDVIFVCLGTAVACGIDLAPIFYAVWFSNMLKVGGGKRDDGKILKPPGWPPPDVAGLLVAQGWRRP